MEKLSLKNRVLVAAFYILSAAVLLYFSDINKVAAAIQKITFLNVILIQGIILCTLVLNAINVYALFGGTKKGFVEFFFQFLKSVIVGKFVPAKAGDFSLALFLKGEKKIGSSTAMVLADKAISLFSNLLLLVLFTIFYFHVFDIFVILGITVVLAAAFTFFFTQGGRQLIRKLLGKRAELFVGFGKELKVLAAKRKAMIALNFVLTLGRLVLQAVIISIGFFAVGLPVNFWVAVFITVASQLATIISFTPNATGIREPVFIAAAASVTANYDLSIAALVILTAMEWLSVAVFIAISSAREASQNLKKGGKK